MRLKYGTRWEQMHASMEHAIRVCDVIFERRVGREAIVTSARDGKHSELSLHYVGKAIDLRTRDIEKATQLAITVQIRQALGNAYDVVLEEDHLHIEYDFR